MRRRWRIWFGILITVALVWFAFRGQPLGKIGDALVAFDYRYLVPAVVLFFIGVWFRALRWSVLLRPVATVTARQAFPVVAIGFMANNVLPLRAGEIARAFVFSRRTGATKTATLATIAVERLFDGLTMLGFILGAATVVSLTSDIRHVAIIAFVVFTGVLLALVLLTLGGDFRDRMIQLALGPLPDRFADRVERMAESFLAGLGVLRRRRDLVVVAGCSVLAWGFEASMYWVIARGFGAELSDAMTPAATLLTTGVANLATLIPSSPGYVGAFEYGVKLVVENVLGVDGALALSYALVVHVALVVPISLYGAVELWRSRISLRQLSDTDDAIADAEATETAEPAAS
jgi:glycosyltransferase 2 family protein